MTDARSDTALSQDGDSPHMLGVEMMRSASSIASFIRLVRSKTHLESVRQAPVYRQNDCRIESSLVTCVY